MVALAGLADVGPRRLALLTNEVGAWERVASMRAGVVPAVQGVSRQLALSWRHQMAGIDLDDLERQYRHHGVSVVALGDEAYPHVLAADPDPPLVICSIGDRSLLDQLGVAVVGTRRCSAAGRNIANNLGGDLVAAGINVVSGLALGIDGAAHVGALSNAVPLGSPEPDLQCSAIGGARGAPVGVVASGLDHPYPARHRDLWSSVGVAGVLISESPLGTPPQKWRFPARNRIIAALSDIVIVVESTEHGGSMSTVVEGLDRDRAIMAVPGPIHHLPSIGTNQLLAEGAYMCRGIDDVLALRSLLQGGVARPGGPRLVRDRPTRTSRAPSIQPSTERSDRQLLEAPPLGTEPDRAPVRLAPARSPRDESVIDALGWEPATFDDVAERSALSIGDVAAALHSLRTSGEALLANGLWERVR